MADSSLSNSCMARGSEFFERAIRRGAAALEVFLVVVFLAALALVVLEVELADAGRRTVRVPAVEEAFLVAFLVTFFLVVALVDFFLLGAISRAF